MLKHCLVIFVIIVLFSLTGCSKETPKTEKSGKETPSENLQTVEFKCDGMTCTGCEETIIKKVKKLEGIKNVESNYKTKITKVIFASGVVTEKDIENTINKAGYRTEVYKGETQHNISQPQKEQDSDKKK